MQNSYDVSPPTTVTLRHLARDFGKAKKARLVLILNPAMFGSSDGSNWLNGVAYATREAAIAAAWKAGRKASTRKATPLDTIGRV